MRASPESGLGPRCDSHNPTVCWTDEGSKKLNDLPSVTHTGSGDCQDSSMYLVWFWRCNLQWKISFVDVEYLLFSPPNSTSFTTLKISLLPSAGAGEKARDSQDLLVFQRTRVHIHVPTLGSSQSPTTLAHGDLTPSPDLHRCPHTHTHNRK